MELGSIKNIAIVKRISSRTASLQILFVLSSLLLFGCSTGPPTNIGGPEHPTPHPTQAAQSTLDSILKALPWGNIAFNVPETIRLDELKPIQLVMSRTKSIEEVRKAIQEKGKVESSPIQISDSMEAILTSSNEAFDITQIGPQRRPISGNQDTVWTWDVRAVKPGTQRLHVVLNAIVKVDGVESPYLIKQFDREYQVYVPWRQKPLFAFLGNNWQWLWTAIFLPIAAWILNQRRKEKKRKKKR